MKAYVFDEMLYIVNDDTIYEAIQNGAHWVTMPNGCHVLVDKAGVPLFGAGTARLNNNSPMSVLINKRILKLFNDTAFYEYELTAKIETVWLNPQEYAVFKSVVNSEDLDDLRDKFVIEKAIGNFIYTFENWGYDSYRVIDKTPIDGTVEGGYLQEWKNTKKKKREKIKHVHFEG